MDPLTLSKPLPSAVPCQCKTAERSPPCGSPQSEHHSGHQGHARCGPCAERPSARRSVSRPSSQRLTTAPQPPCPAAAHHCPAATLPRSGSPLPRSHPAPQRITTAPQPPCPAAAHHCPAATLPRSGSPLPRSHPAQQPPCPAADHHCPAATLPRSGSPLPRSHPAQQRLTTAPQPPCPAHSSSQIRRAAEDRKSRHAARHCGGVSKERANRKRETQIPTLVSGLAPLTKRFTHFYPKLRIIKRTKTIYQSSNPSKQL
ncbi:hypothetical protein NDU88_000997 [Pleurodeles waltl]|uniref:Uncharacterized protein n=1 Tax=Pleurodeles waltl TaxID=8319 RepID=A0AAV7SYP1_PLEWA|nr:hypothetical protein NDU88_000997 [Pleurodeles waltl]